MISYRHNIPSTNGLRAVVVDDDPPLPRKAGRYIVHDWDKIEIRAQRGLLPPAPKLSASGERAVKKLKQEIVRAARSGDLQALTAIKVPGYNSTVRILRRYQNACVTALRASKVARP